MVAFKVLIHLTFFISLQVLGAPTTGVYSGSFDPPTDGHKVVALEASEKLGLDKLYVIVKTSSVEKNFKAAAAERVELVKKMFKGSSKLEVIVLEEWYDSKKEMRKEILKHETKGIYLLFGNDVYQKNYERFSDLPNTYFAVNLRKESEFTPEIAKPDGWLKERSTYLHLKGEKGISSSLVRSKLLNNESLEGLLPLSVQRYISSNNLYNPYLNLEEFKRQKNYEQRAYGFLKAISIIHPTLSIPLKVGKYMPLQSVKGEQERIIRSVIKANKLYKRKAMELRLKLLNLKYGRSSVKVRSDRVFSCRRVI